MSHSIRALLPALIAAVSLGLLGLAPPAALAAASSGRATAASQAPDPCYPTGKLPGPSAIAAARHGLTVEGPVRPYVSEPTLYCGTLTLPGKPATQPVDIEINDKVVTSVDAGVDRSWHAFLSLASAKPASIRAVWHRGKRGQLVSAPLVVHPNRAQDTRPTSLDLIARALAAHRITGPAALVDQVYALLAPFKLPRSLTSSRPLPELGDSDVLASVATGWNSLSAAQKASVLPLLGPYKFARQHGRQQPGKQQSGKQQPAARPALACDRLFTGFGGEVGNDVVVPPFDSKVPPGWAFIGTKHFKIWYLTKNILFTTAAQSKATALLLAHEAEHVWDAETGLFGRTPPSDASQPCNGGDGRLDIYVYRESTAASALTLAFQPYACHNASSYLSIAPDYANTVRDAQAVLAHEFFHTIELSYNSINSCLQTGWLGEATGNWAIDFVYPSNNEEQFWAKDYFSCEYKDSLDQSNSCYSNFHTGYDDYIYLFFLAHRFDPDVIPAIWDKLQHTSPRAAIDDAVPGGIAASWYQFALDLWNRDPNDDFTTWDSIPFMLSDDPTANIELDGKHSRVIQWEDRSAFLPTLSSNYQYFPVTDRNVTQITFSRYGFSKPPEPGIRIDAVIELGDGKFEQADWTPGEDMTFCRQQADQNIESVLLMYSDGNIAQTANYGRGEQIKVRDACTPTGYTGSIKNVLTINNSSEDVTQTANATVKFKFDSAVSNPDLGQYQFDTTGGKVKLKFDGTSGGCTVDGSGSFAIAKWNPPTQPTGPGGQVIFNDGVSPKSPYSGDGATNDSTPITVHWVCPTSSFDGSYNMAGQWWATDNGVPTNKVKFHQELTGSYTMTGPDGVTNTWTWNLAPIFGS